MANKIEPGDLLVRPKLKFNYYFFVVKKRKENNVYVLFDLKNKDMFQTMIFEDHGLVVIKPSIKNV